MLNKLKQLIHDGEGLTVEFKRCESELSSSVYETVSSFSNRYGGHILLGVEDDGKVVGVAPGAVDKIKKNFANSLNNPQRFAPTLYLALEEAEINGKTVLWCFVPIDDQSVSLRSKIARELVSNILVHREYTSAYPAKIIIERDHIVTENWSLPRTPGRIDPCSFTPYPKNPLLANFFINIGRADVLGSGVRNLYEFTKLYSGGEPELIDGDVFRTIVPLNLSDIELSDNVSDNVSDNEDMSDNLSDNEDMSDKTYRKTIFAYLEKNGEINATKAAELIGRNPRTARRILLQLVDEDIVAATGANRNRVYRYNKR